MADGAPEPAFAPDEVREQSKHRRIGTGPLPPACRSHSEQVRAARLQKAGHHYACRRCGVCRDIPNEWEKTRTVKCGKCGATTTCNAWRNMDSIVDPQEYTCLLQTFKRAQTEARAVLTSWPSASREVWQEKIALWESATGGLLQKWPDLEHCPFFRSPPSECEQDDLWERWHSQSDDEIVLEEAATPWHPCFACGVAKDFAQLDNGPMPPASQVKCDSCDKTTTLLAWKKRPRITHSPRLYNQTVSAYKQSPQGSDVRGRLGCKLVRVWPQVESLQFAKDFLNEEGVRSP